MSDHSHRYEFTRDGDVLASVAQELDWPTDAAEKLDQVSRCACGQLDRVAWTGPGESEGYIPAWLTQRVLTYVKDNPSG